MGMIGNYAALDEPTIELIANQDASLEDMELPEGAQLDIDKSWQGIHYLLCGDIADGAPPLGYVVPMLDEQMTDFGEFGAFYVYPNQVLEAYHAISEFTEEHVRSLYDFDQMAEDQVYPIVTGEDREEFFSYLWSYFKEIRSFYQKVSSEGKGVVFYIF